MASCPSLTELIIERNEREIRQKEPRLRAEARAMGVENPEDKDLWALLRRINRAHDEKRRPEVEARAERLGVPIKGFFGGKREVWEISYDCYREEDRQHLCRQLGYS